MKEPSCSETTSGSKYQNGEVSLSHTCMLHTFISIPAPRALQIHLHAPLPAASAHNQAIEVPYYFLFPWINGSRMAGPYGTSVPMYGRSLCSCFPRRNADQIDECDEAPAPEAGSSYIREECRSSKRPSRLRESPVTLDEWMDGHPVFLPGTVVAPSVTHA